MQTSIKTRLVTAGFIVSWRTESDLKVSGLHEGGTQEGDKTSTNEWIRKKPETTRREIKTDDAEKEIGDTR